MNAILKSIVKTITPLAARDFFRLYLHFRHSRTQCWSGVYEHYRDIPARGPGYAGERLAERTYQHTKQILTTLDTHHSIPSKVTGEHVLLPLVVSFISQKLDKVKILDFGGGMGLAYIYLGIRSERSVKRGKKEQRWG